jgi:hypothetical protein
MLLEYQLQLSTRPLQDVLTSLYPLVPFLHPVPMWSFLRTRP